MLNKWRLNVLTFKCIPVSKLVSMLAESMKLVPLKLASYMLTVSWSRTPWLAKEELALAFGVYVKCEPSLNCEAYF